MVQAERDGYLKKVLVTGGAGFFGLHLSRNLLDRGCTVRILDCADLDNPALEGKVEFIKGDILDPAAVGTAATGVDAVIHNAAVVPISRSGKRFWTVNVDGTRNVLTHAEKAGVKKLVYISSSSAYGIPEKIPIDESVPLNPFGKYGTSKAAGEKICEEFKSRMDISIIRPRTILDEGRLGVQQILFDWVKKGKNFYIFGKGDNRFQLVSAKDLAEACCLTLEKSCRGEDFNIGAQEFTTLRGDLEGFVTNAGTKTKIVSVPTRPARAVLQVLDFLRISPFVDYHYYILSHDVWFDTKKAETMLGWKAKDSNIDMLTRAYTWYLAHEKELDKEVGTTHRKKVKLGIVKLVKWIS
ncbi:MAG: NAD-dependent epimerase/dehydratase family protein [Chitinivibrionales bacterium]|nr:NAD-dependent epimerase/dehydratase family protein [Chitinivibrionales bacterium]